MRPSALTSSFRAAYKSASLRQLLQRSWRPGLPRQPCRPNSGALSADMPRLGVARAGGNSAAAAAHGSVCAHVRLERIPAPTAARKPQAIYHTCVHASDRIDSTRVRAYIYLFILSRAPAVVYACMARRLYMIYASGLEHKMPTGLGSGRPCDACCSPGLHRPRGQRIGRGRSAARCR
jgi:hypothetical protein